MLPTVADKEDAGKEDADIELKKKRESVAGLTPVAESDSKEVAAKKWQLPRHTHTLCGTIFFYHGCGREH